MSSPVALDRPAPISTRASIARVMRAAVQDGDLGALERRVAAILPDCLASVGASWRTNGNLALGAGGAQGQRWQAEMTPAGVLVRMSPLSGGAVRARAETLARREAIMRPTPPAHEPASRFEHLARRLRASVHLLRRSCRPAARRRSASPSRASSGSRTAPSGEPGPAGDRAHDARAECLERQHGRDDDRRQP